MSEYRVARYAASYLRVGMICVFGFAVSGCEMKLAERSKPILQGFTNPFKRQDAAMLNLGAVSANLPRGFCVERTRKLAEGQGYFALVLPCEGIKSETVVTVMTKTYSDPLAPAPVKLLEAGFSSQSRGVLKTKQDYAVVQLRDGKLVPIEGRSDIHWRGVKTLGKTAVKVAVYGKKSKMSGKTPPRELSKILGSAIVK